MKQRRPAGGSPPPGSYYTPGRTCADDAAALPDAGQRAQVNVPALLLALGADDVVALRVAAHLRQRKEEGVARRGEWVKIGDQQAAPCKTTPKPLNRSILAPCTAPGICLSGGVTTQPIYCPQKNTGDPHLGRKQSRLDVRHQLLLVHAIGARRGRLHADACIHSLRGHTLVLQA